MTDTKLKDKTPDIRFLDDMRDVLYDQNWAEKAENSELYYMYRGIKEKEDLRYDITIIPPKMLGKEFVKTKGHYHIGKYSEVYIVLEGEAIYLMQKRGGDDSEIDDAFAVRARQGEIVIIPSEYGHITINPLREKTLKMANWVAKSCKSDYAPIGKMKGACYFYTENGWIENKNYKKIPPLKFRSPEKNVPEDLTFLLKG